jgi:hypothetical protein
MNTRTLTSSSHARLRSKRSQNRQFGSAKTAICLRPSPRFRLMAQPNGRLFQHRLGRIAEVAILLRQDERAQDRHPSPRLAQPLAPSHPGSMESASVIARPYPCRRTASVAAQPPAAWISVCSVELPLSDVRDADRTDLDALHADPRVAIGEAHRAHRRQCKDSSWWKVNPPR